MRPGSIQSEFERFHRENPSVYRTLVRLARAYKARTGRAPGIGMLWEVMRWEMALETKGAEFKLDNNFRSRYARLIMAQEPDLAGAFELRRLRAA